MSRLRKWRSLSWADRRLVLQATGMLVRARFRLPSIDFRPEPALAADAGPASPEATMLPRAQAVARLVGMAAAVSPVAVACLHRSLVLWSLLRREGIPCRLRLGAAETGTGPFEAHAWVECAGVALNEPEAYLARYSPFGRAVVPVDRGRVRWRPTRRRPS